MWRTDPSTIGKVRVYRNLTRKCWSVVPTGGILKGLVVAHLQDIVLKDCRFVVRQGGRRRVLATGRKNVHAFVVGHYLGEQPWHAPFKVPKPVRYNPRECTTFIRADSGEPVASSPLVTLRGDGKVFMEAA